MFLVLALVLLLVLPWPWSLVAFVSGLVLFFGEVLFWHRRVRGRRKAVGAQTLIEKAATVVSTCRPVGQVRLSGEIWAARCDGGAEIGETVTIVGRDRLTLIVERRSLPKATGQDDDIHSGPGRKPSPGDSVPCTRVRDVSCSSLNRGAPRIDLRQEG